MAIEKFTISGTDSAIWAEADNLNYFLQTPLVADAAGGVVNKQATVKAHTRRRYPGDPNPINVSTHSRDFMVDPGAKYSRGLPGKPFRVVSDAGLPGEENRQFTYQGDWMDIHALFVGDAAMQVYLYSGRGRYTVAAAGTP
jgi:hypothetical protein